MKTSSPMVLSPRTFTYVSLLVFNQLVSCNHYVQNGTGSASARLVGLRPSSDSITSARKHVDDRTPARTVTLGCESDRNNGGNASCELVETTVAKRSVAAVSQWNANATTPKPKKFQKSSATGAAARVQTTTTKRPPTVRQSATAKASNKKSPWTVQSGLQNSTVWPKPNKRLSGKNNRTNAKTSIANRTADADLMAKYPIAVWKDHGFYTDDYIKLINGHWLKFAPPSSTAHYVLGILYTVIMVFGCFGNSLVIFMYIKCKSLQTPANVLIMNLAVSDFFMLAKTPVFIYNSYYQGPTLGKLGCQVYGFFGGLTGTVSIMTLAAISLDRYYVIVHPLNAAVKTTKQRARIWIGFIWLYGFSFSVVPVLDLGYNRYVPEGYLTSCSFDYLTDDAREKGFILVFFTAAWCIPFTMISYCYFKILTAVWVTSEMAGSRFGQEEEKRKTEIRLGYVVVGVIVLWFLSWTPYAVVALLGVFDQKKYITPLGSMVPALFCKAASCTDPWIYAITHPRFKNELTKLFSRKKTRKLERDYGTKKGWDNQSRSAKSAVHRGGGNCSSTEDEDVDEVIVMVNPDDNGMRRQGSTSSHKTDETKALETKFPPTRQESLKYMPPSWYKLPRTSSKSSIKLQDVTKTTADDYKK